MASLQNRFQTAQLVVIVALFLTSETQADNNLKKESNDGTPTGPTTPITSSTFAASTTECKEKDFPHLADMSGIIVVNRVGKQCGVKAKDSVKFFGIKTNGLGMTSSDYIEVSSEDIIEKSKKLFGPFEPGYLLFGYTEPAIVFNYNVSTASEVFIEYVQEDQTIPLDCDTREVSEIFTAAVNKFEVLFKKSIKDPSSIQILGAKDNTFGRYLMNDSQLKVSITTRSASESKIIIKKFPALAECSREIQANTDSAFQLTGPSSAPQGPYTCVTILRSTIQNIDSHFDVDFSNFIKLSHLDDELIIDDGFDPSIIIPSVTSQYSGKQVSFRGNNLDVMYNSLGPWRPTNIPFKLTVRAKSYGGLVTEDRELVIPKNITASFTLRPQAGKAVSVILDKVSGLQIVLSDGNKKSIVIPANSYLPPILSLGQPDRELYLTVTSSSKFAGTVQFKSIEPSCGGILFETSGVLSAKATDKTCSWLIGPQSSLLSFSYANLGSDGCIEIRSLSQDSPSVKRCQISQDQVLPRMFLNQSYVQVTLGENNSELHATLSPSVINMVDVSRLSQRNITSLAYPSGYPWSSRSDVISLDATGKSMTLSINDLDLRKGESMKINDVEIQGNPISLPFYDISNNKNKIDILRSTINTDLDYHRGYKLSIFEFEKILVANLSQNSIVTPRNLSSILIKVQANKLNRLAYNLTFSSAEKNLDIKVVDSKSLVGPVMKAEELHNGTTTSDTLLLSVVANKINATIPSLVLQYKQQVCNQTIDHVCDESTRCVPADKLCKGQAYCQDGSDLKRPCSSGPWPVPRTVDKGFGGFTVFVISVIMFSFGVLGTLYGPDLFRNLEGRFRSGQYTTFTSTE